MAFSPRAKPSMKCSSRPQARRSAVDCHPKGEAAKTTQGPSPRGVRQDDKRSTAVFRVTSLTAMPKARTQAPQGLPARWWQGAKCFAGLGARAQCLSSSMPNTSFFEDGVGLQRAAVNLGCCRPLRWASAHHHRPMLALLSGSKVRRPGGNGHWHAASCKSRFSLPQACVGLASEVSQCSHEECVQPAAARSSNHQETLTPWQPPIPHRVR